MELKSTLFSVSGVFVLDIVVHFILKEKGVAFIILFDQIEHLQVSKTLQAV